jgi:glycosyltransferase involved in cell wall biosynthesis
VVLATEGSYDQRQKIVVVMPAYNAEKTLRRTWEELPHDLVDEVVLVDDA